jgi:hypothetical protein
MRAKFRTYGAAFSKACKQLEMGRLAAVQKAGTQNVTGLEGKALSFCAKAQAGPAYRNQTLMILTNSIALTSQSRAGNELETDGG